MHRLKDMTVVLPRRVAMTRWFSAGREATILRETQLASLAVSSLLSAMGSHTPATDVQAYAHSESEILRSVTNHMVATRVRPSPLTGMTRAAFGIAGLALAAVPPRIQHACIGGVYDALGTMHTDHLRELLEHAGDGSNGTNAQLRNLTKHLRDAHLGAPEGSSPSGKATDLIFRALMNKGEALEVDTATVAAATTGELLAVLLRASRSL
jgi:demethoxyubiquinone hydroxylase (CLK1/Coq7/Cat5 family)